MSDRFNQSPGSGGDGGPPGQDLLAISLALLAAVLGTPMLFEYVGPLVRRLVMSAYGSEDFADLMYFASFGLSGVAIFSVCRMTLWYAMAGIVAFGGTRFGALAF